MMQAPRKLLHYVRKHIVVLWTAVGLSALLGVLESLRTVLIGYVFIAFFGKDAASNVRVVAEGARHYLDFSKYSSNALLALLIGTTIIKVITEYGAITASAYLGQSVVRDLRVDVFRKILNQPLRFFDRNPTG